MRHAATVRSGEESPQECAARMPACGMTLDVKNSVPLWGFDPAFAERGGAGVVH